MIGWKIACNIGGNDVVATIASQPTTWVVNGGTDGIIIMVYHDEKLRQLFVDRAESLKVIEKASMK